MADPTLGRTSQNPVSRWWKALSSRGRERVVLGACVGAALAARDLVLLGSSALAFGALELADVLAPRAPSPAPA